MPPSANCLTCLGDCTAPEKRCNLRAGVGRAASRRTPGGSILPRLRFLSRFTIHPAQGGSMTLRALRPRGRENRASIGRKKALNDPRVTRAATLVAEALENRRML